MPPELWSERKTAEHFGVSLQTLRRWVRLKEISCIKIQGVRWFAEKHISDCIWAHEQVAGKVDAPRRRPTKGKLRLVLMRGETA